MPCFPVGPWVFHPPTVSSDNMFYLQIRGRSSVSGVDGCFHGFLVGRLQPSLTPLACRGQAKVRSSWAATKEAAVSGMCQEVIPAAQDVFEHLRCVPGTQKVEPGEWRDCHREGQKLLPGHVCFCIIAPGSPVVSRKSRRSRVLGPDFGPERNCKMQDIWCAPVDAS